MSDIGPYLRGNRFPAFPGVPYPRADPRDVARLPADTWACAQLPVSVRIELVGDARAVDVGYRTATNELGYRGEGGGTAFAVWRGQALVGEVPARLGEGRARLALGRTGSEAEERVVVYLPESMRPEVLSLEGVDGAVEPAPPQPRWTAYGDSVAEGWVASSPAGAWPAAAARRHGLDVANLGYAGSARGETVSAEHVAGLEADVISITHGTNCWTRIPHSTDQMRANTDAFLEIVRRAHPSTPVIVASPVVRPDAERTPNNLGATLADLRRSMEEVVAARIDSGDDHLTIVPGADLLDPDLLADGIHPGDEGHRVLAEQLGAVVAAAVGSVGVGT